MFALVKNETVTNPVTQETSDVQIIKLFSPYTVWEDKHGTQYSPDSLLTLTADQKQDLGIYDVAYGNRNDDRFYTITENQMTFDQDEKIVKVTYSAAAKAIGDVGESKGLKSQWIAQTNQTANSLLAQSDWMLVRKIERSVDVPANMVTYRAAVIAEANRLTTAIAAATNVTQLIIAIDSTSWPTVE
jgi:hypothetical protein